MADNLDDLTPEEIAAIDDILLAPGDGPETLPAEDYEQWLKDNFPAVVAAPMADRHRNLWSWVMSIKPTVTPPPRVEVWARGSAKSTTARLAATNIGERLGRRFCLYVSETQEQADTHVGAISAFFQTRGYGPALTKQGTSKGWRRNQLRVDNGFNVAAMGLDTAVRGINLEQFRPDLIIFDDVDNRNDTPAKTTKKENAITNSILPAGSSDCVVLFVQNLIIEDGIVSRMVDGRAPYLLNAEIIGPIKAIDGLEVEDAQLPNGRWYKKIVKGVATWAGQTLETCQRQIMEWGWAAFKREAQHEVAGADGYFFEHGKMRSVADLPGGFPGTRRWRFCRAWDLAATEGGGDYTVGVLIACSIDGGIGNEIMVVVDVVREQFEPAKVKRLIARTTESDRVKYGVVKTHFPQDPSQAGKDQAQTYGDRFRGAAGDKPVPVTIESVRGKKWIRASRWAEQVNDGNAYLCEGEWNWAFVEEHRKFRADEEHDFDDQVDAASDACTELAGKRAGTAKGTPRSPMLAKRHGKDFI